MIFLLAVVSTVLVLGFAYGARAVFGVLSEVSETLARTRADQREWLDGGAKGMETRFRDLEDLVDRLPQRWEDIKLEASRLDGRARYAVNRVRTELAERGETDDAIEGLAGELHLVDGDAGEQIELSEMPEALETDQPAEGWRAQINRMISERG